MLIQGHYDYEHGFHQVGPVRVPYWHNLHDHMFVFVSNVLEDT